LFAIQLTEKIIYVHAESNNGHRITSCGSQGQQFRSGQAGLCVSVTLSNTAMCVGYVMKLKYELDHY